MITLLLWYGWLRMHELQCSELRQYYYVLVFFLIIILLRYVWVMIHEVLTQGIVNVYYSYHEQKFWDINVLWLYF